MYSECWGTEMMLGLETSSYGSALVGHNNVEHLHLDLRYCLCHRHHLGGNVPQKGTVPTADGPWGSLGTAGPVPLPAKPQLQHSKWFLQQDAGDATDVTRGCILEPRREHSFHTPNLFFPPSDTFFYRVSI